MQPNTQNLNLSAHESMDGMFSFDATSMAPIGTECMIHTKPNRCCTWGYHSMKAWYFTPALNHRCVKVVTDAGTVRVMDTFKFLHHTPPVPTISPTNRIVKATKQLKLAIEGNTNADPNVLAAIANLHALLTGTQPDPLLPNSPPPPSAHELEKEERQPAKLPPLWQPDQTTQKEPSLSNKPTPTTSPFDNNELDDTTVWDNADNIPLLCRYSRLANKLLAKCLDLEGYYQCQLMLGLWRHKWCNITFSLLVDDFGIKTVGLSHAKHLKHALEKYYNVTVDWKGELFCGIKLDWDYKKQTVDLSMPNYIPK
ncbi:hypothetical protein ACHAW6_009271, partial [Cyclotella cf. meneghiniana]